MSDNGLEYEINHVDENIMTFKSVREFLYRGTLPAHENEPEKMKHFKDNISKYRIEQQEGEHKTTYRIVRRLSEIPRVEKTIPNPQTLSTKVFKVNHIELQASSTNNKPSLNHKSLSKTLHSIKKEYYWSTLDHDIQELYEQCSTCNPILANNGTKKNNQNNTNVNSNNNSFNNSLNNISNEMDDIELLEAANFEGQIFEQILMKALESPESQKSGSSRRSSTTSQDHNMDTTDDHHFDLDENQNSGNGDDDEQPMNHTSSNINNNNNNNKGLNDEDFSDIEIITVSSDEEDSGSGSGLNSSSESENEQDIKRVTKRQPNATTDRHVVSTKIGPIIITRNINNNNNKVNNNNSNSNNSNIKPTVRKSINREIKVDHRHLPTDPAAKRSRASANIAIDNVLRTVNPKLHNNNTKAQELKSTQKKQTPSLPPRLKTKQSPSLPPPPKSKQTTPNVNKSSPIQQQHQQTTPKNKTTTTTTTTINSPPIKKPTFMTPIKSPKNTGTPASPIPLNSTRNTKNLQDVKPAAIIGNQLSTRKRQSLDELINEILSSSNVNTPASIVPEPEIGCEVEGKSLLEDYKDAWFKGVITKALPDDKYTIKYHDGGEEDLHLSRLKPNLREELENLKMSDVIIGGEYLGNYKNFYYNVYVLEILKSSVRVYFCDLEMTKTIKFSQLYFLSSFNKP